MTWQLILAYAVTIPAVIIGFGACFYFIIRRIDNMVEIQRMFRDHIESPHCRCEGCRAFKSS